MSLSPVPFSQWRHFKGEVYTVICVAQHTESKELMVVYANPQGVTYTQPLEMFFGEVQKGIKRFTEMK